MEDIDIYNRISIINVKNKLGLKEKYAKGDIIYVRCPFCTESNVGNLKLNVVKDSYYCRRCGEKGLAIGLYARCNLITNKEAYIKLISEEADMTTSLVSIKKAIKKHELIKINVLKTYDGMEIKELGQLIADTIAGELILVVGRVITIYKKNEEINAYGIN